MFRGEVNTPLSLVNLPGRNGLSLEVTAFYSSSVGQAARTWNETAPTGLLGLGWSLSTDRVLVDDKSTGNPLDGDYYLQCGGSVDRLEWCGESDGVMQFQCRLRPLWQVRYLMALQTWQIVREDGSVATYGKPDSEGAVMYGVAWGNWIGASRAPSQSLRRYPIAWNLSKVTSPWGDVMTWAYDNDEVEVAGGLSYTRASYVRLIVDPFGRSVTFRYLPKEPFEYAPPHQTPDGGPDTAFQDRYETRALKGLDVHATESQEGLLYSLDFDYELADVSAQQAGAARQGQFTKRFLHAVRQHKHGRLAAPPTRFEYDLDAESANPGALTAIQFPEGGRAEFAYTEVTLGTGGDEFKKNITVPNPIPGSRPLVFNGPNYVAIAWYSDTKATTVIQVYSFGGRWSKPWTTELPGRIRPEFVRAATSGDFFALYLSPTSAPPQAVIHLFQKEPGRFGEWRQHQLQLRRPGKEIPEETALRVGDRFVVAHLGGDSLVYRFWFDPFTEQWQREEHGRGTTKVALAALRNYYIVAWYDQSSGTAPYQIFHRDLTGEWVDGPIGGSGGQRFDWDPLYSQSYWALAGSFAVATYLATDSQPKLRIIAWDSGYAVAHDELRPGRSLATVVAGALVGNGPLLLRFDGQAWRTFEFGSTIDPVAYAYSDDLAVRTVASGSRSTSTAVAYVADSGTWRIATYPQAAAGTETEAGTDTIDQIWPPSASGPLMTAGDQIRWRQPNGQLPSVGTLPASGAKRSLINRGPDYLAFEDQPSDPSKTTTIAQLFANGQAAQAFRFPGQRIATDDPIVSGQQLAGGEAFVTYPAGQLAARPTELYLHRIGDDSLADELAVPVVSSVTISDGYAEQLTSYDYDAAIAVPDATGKVVQFPRASRVNGRDGSGGRAVYSFYNGLEESNLPALRHTSRGALAAAGPAYSLLAGLVREAIVLDADGFEVSASHSLWSTLPLQHGTQSPVGLLLPITEPKLTRSTEIVGRLHLFEVPSALASDFDAGVIPVQARAEFVGHGLALADDASVRTLTAGARWEILSGDHEYPIAARNGVDRGLDVYGISRQDVTNTYDPATGFLLEQATTRTSSNGETEQITRTLLPAWRVPRYAALAAARMLTAQAGETIANVTRQVTVSSTATTYRSDWRDPAQDADPAEQAAPAEPGDRIDQGVWAEHEAWTWLGGPAVAPEFDYDVDAPRPGWRRDEAFTARGEFGQPLVSVDVSGVATSTLFDASGQHEVAALLNVDLLTAPRSASYLGFESYEDQQGWRRPNAGPLDDLITDEDAHTGRRALRLPGQSDGSPVEASFETPAGTGRLLLDCWVKTEPVFPAGDQAGWHIQLRSAAGTEASRFLPIADTGGTWQRLWTYLDPPQPEAATSINCRLVNFVGGHPVLVDDVRFAPLLGGVDAQVYDEQTFALSAALDTNNNATSYYYDEFGRQIAAIDDDRRVREVSGVSFALGAGQERFDPGNPNAQITVTPAGPGFIEEFLDGSGWRTRWDAEPLDDWAAADEVLWHAGASPGSVTLRDSDDFACYGVRLDFRRPDAPLLLAGTGPGEAQDGPPAAGIAIGRVSVTWDPSGEWRLLDGTAIVDRAPAPALRSGSWLLVATDHAVTFFTGGTLILRHWFADQVKGPLRLIAGGQELGFTRIMVFHQPRLAIQYADGCGQPRQLQRLGDEGTLTSGALPDQLGRPAITTKSMLYAAEPPGYRPRFVTGVDWATGRLSGDLAEYYAGGERSDDGGYPYSRTLLEPAETGREIESGQPGATLAIDGPEPHTARLGYAANVTSGFLDNLPAGQYPQLRLTDQNGNTSLRYTDRAGNLIGTRDVPGPAGADADADADRDERTSFSYDGRGALTAIYPPNYYAPPAGTDPDDYVITRTVDGLGQLLSTHSSDEGTTEYIYDARGLQRFVLTQAGRSGAPGRLDWVLYYSYDLLGRPTETGQFATRWDRERLTALANSDWPVDAPDWYERLAWDGDGSAASAIGMHTASTRNLGPGRPVLEVSLDYDRAGHVTRYTERLAGEPGWQADYGYLGTGELTRIGYPSAPGAGQAPMVVTYGYDLLGQLTRIGTPEVPDRFASYAYNANGGLEREVIGLAGPDRVSRRYQVNSPGWPVSIESDALTEKISYWETPGYDGARYYDGRAARLDLTSSAGLEESWLLAYHRDGRLRVAQCLNAPQYSIGVGQPISYDGNGNLLAAEDGGTSRAFAYEPGTDRLSSVSPGSGTYSYDPSGAITGTPDPRHLRLETDLVSGLVTGIATTQGRHLDLTYGLDTHRLLSDLRDVDGGSLATRSYLFGSGDAPLAERVTGPDGGSEITYVYGVGGMVGLISGDVQAGVVRDRLGSSRLLVAEGGDLLGGYSYRPFGDSLGGVTGSRPDLLRYRFTGQEWDEVTGLYNYGARLYDPVTYRFYQPDPASSELSPYVFVADDPVNLVDPDGELAFIPLLIAMGVGALVGGIVGGVTSGASITEGRFWIGVGIGAGVGALAGALGYGASALFMAGITAAGYTAASATTAGFILSGAAAGAIGGAVDGAVTGGLTQLFGNIVDGKRGSSVWDGVGAATGWGALAGGVTGGLVGAGTGVMIRRSFSRPSAILVGKGRSVRAEKLGMRMGIPVDDLTTPGALDNAFTRGGQVKLNTHGENTGTTLLFNATRADTSVMAGHYTGDALGTVFRNRFTSVDLLACYPGKGEFGQAFATASRSVTRAPVGKSTLHNVGPRTIQQGTRVLTFYPNKFQTGFVRLFGY